MDSAMLQAICNLQIPLYALFIALVFIGVQVARLVEVLKSK